MMRNRFRRFRLGVSAKIYLQMALSAGLVAALAGGSIIQSQQAEIAALNLYQGGFVQLQQALVLEQLFSQHRRIVESAPAEFDRERLLGDEKTLADIDAKFLSALSPANSTSVRAGSETANESLRQRIATDLPELFEASRQVFFFAKAFAQDKALEAVTGPYATVAQRIEASVKGWQDVQLSKAAADFAALKDAGESLLQWSVTIAILALALTAIGAFLLRQGVIVRLRRVTNKMLKLARNDIGVDVPFQDAQDEIGDIARALQVFKTNAIELLNQKAELEHANTHFQAALANMSQGLCLFDSNQRLIVCNDRYVRMYAIPPELSIPGTPYRAILEHRVRTGSSDGVEPKPDLGGRASEADQRAVTRELADGRSISIWHEQMPDGGWVTTHEDITERKRIDKQIARMAHHDALTDLPNRNLLRERLEDAIQNTCGNGRVFALLFLDLDRFKAVNDIFGHPTGDALLQEVAERLLACVGGDGVIARLGGDEFAILYTAREQPEAAADLADRLIDSLKAPYDLNGNIVNISASIGIALCPNDGVDIESLFKNADLALYKAKADGRNKWCFFEPDMGLAVQAQRELEFDLKKAVERQELVLFYQPVVNFDCGEIVGFEALLRWQHPTRGLVPPAKFIALAEEIGAIGSIGDWVVRQACQEAIRWDNNLFVAVNLSPRQFNSPSTLGLVVAGALADSGLAPNRLELEMTESVILDDSVGTLAILHELRSLGVRIALDDFGTGYSSLSYLRKFPFDKIKIDQSFVGELTSRDDCAAIVQAVIGLAQSMGMVTTAEGVETADQFDKLSQAGCTEAQGYLFSRPRPAKDIDRMLRSYAGSVGPRPRQTRASRTAD